MEDCGLRTQAPRARVKGLLASSSSGLGWSQNSWELCLLRVLLQTELPLFSAPFIHLGDHEVCLLSAFVLVLQTALFRSYYWEAINDENFWQREIASSVDTCYCSSSQRTTVPWRDERGTLHLRHFFSNFSKLILKVDLKLKRNQYQIIFPVTEKLKCRRT